MKPFDNKVWLSSPTMHGEEKEYMIHAYETNWMSTLGANINAIEETIGEKLENQYAVALSTGTAALHLAIRLAGERLYGQSKLSHGVFERRRVFCSDMTFDATVNPVIYENGVPVFVDVEYETWNMDPVALERAFEMYPEVRLVIVANLYGTPSLLPEIREICDRHKAILIEDAAESLGAVSKDAQGKYHQSGTYGDYNCLSFNGNKIITGSAGGMLLARDEEAVQQVRKWSEQSRDPAPWYQHTELGYNYRMSNVIAGVVRGQWLHLEEHIEKKKAIYERYKEGLADLPVTMNPYPADIMKPNFWLSCCLIDKDAMCEQVRTDSEAHYVSSPGKSCPTEILEAIAALNAEGRPIWKPMQMQPIYRMNPFVTANGSGRARSNAYIRETGMTDVGADIFVRGLCLPSDNKMTEEQQSVIIGIIRRCFE